MAKQQVLGSVSLFQAWYPVKLATSYTFDASPYCPLAHTPTRIIYCWIFIFVRSSGNSHKLLSRTLVPWLEDELFGGFYKYDTETSGQVADG